MHRLMRACVSRQLPEDEARQQHPAEQASVKSPKQRSHGYSFSALKSPWRRRRSERAARRPASTDAEALAASYASTPAGADPQHLPQVLPFNSAPPHSDRRRCQPAQAGGSPANSQASGDQQWLRPVRSITMDNFELTSPGDSGGGGDVAVPNTNGRLQLKPSAEIAAPPHGSCGLEEKSHELLAEQKPEDAEAPSLGSQPPLAAETPLRAEAPEEAVNSEAHASADNESLGSGLPVGHPPCPLPPPPEASAAARRSHLASASSLDSDDLMLGTDSDDGGAEEELDDDAGGLGASRSGFARADTLNEEEEGEGEDADAAATHDDNDVSQAAAGEDSLGSLMTASLPPDSLARHLRHRQQQPPLSLSLVSGALRFRPRSVSSPQGDLLLLPGSDLRHLAHDVTGVKTLLLRMRRLLLDDGLSSVAATPTGGGGGVCQLCGSADAQCVAELEYRVAELQAEVDRLRDQLHCRGGGGRVDPSG